MYWFFAAWWLFLFITHCCGIEHNAVVEGCAYFGCVLWFLSNAIENTF